MDTEILIKKRQFENHKSSFEDMVSEKRLRKNDLQRSIQNLEARLQDLNLQNKEQASVFLKELVQQQKKLSGEKLSELGNVALQYCFGSEYKLVIEVDGTATNSKAEVWIMKSDNEDEKEDPMEENAGGILDIIGTAIRLVVMDNLGDQFSDGHGQIDGPIIMDEPFKMVSKEYTPLLSEFIANVSKDFGRQIIVVTHNDYLASMTTSNIYVQIDKRKSQINVQNN